MNEPTSVTYSITEILKSIDEKFNKIDNKLDKMSEDITELKVGQAKLTEKVEGMDHRLKSVEGTQKNQVWTLIILLAGAIATAAARLFFSPNP